MKKSDGYLFGVDEPINNPVGGTGGTGGADIGGDDVAALRAAMGLPEKKKERGREEWQTQLL